MFSSKTPIKGRRQSGNSFHKTLPSYSFDESSSATSTTSNLNNHNKKTKKLHPLATSTLADSAAQESMMVDDRTENGDGDDHHDASNNNTSTSTSISGPFRAPRQTFPVSYGYGAPIAANRPANSRHRRNSSKGGASSTGTAAGSDSRDSRAGSEVMDDYQAGHQDPEPAAVRYARLKERTRATGSAYPPPPITTSPTNTKITTRPATGPQTIGRNATPTETAYKDTSVNIATAFFNHTPGSPPQSASGKRRRTGGRQNASSSRQNSYEDDDDRDGDGDGDENHDDTYLDDLEDEGVGDMSDSNLTAKHRKKRSRKQPPAHSIADSTVNTTFDPDFLLNNKSKQDDNTYYDDDDNEDDEDNDVSMTVGAATKQATPVATRKSSRRRSGGNKRNNDPAYKPSGETETDSEEYSDNNTNRSRRTRARSNSKRGPGSSSNNNNKTSLANNTDLSAIAVANQLQHNASTSTASSTTMVNDSSKASETDPSYELRSNSYDYAPEERIYRQLERSYFADSGDSIQQQPPPPEQPYSSSPDPNFPLLSNFTSKLYATANNSLSTSFKQPSLLRNRHYPSPPDQQLPHPHPQPHAQRVPKSSPSPSATPPSELISPNNYNIDQKQDFDYLNKAKARMEYPSPTPSAAEAPSSSPSKGIGHYAGLFLRNIGLSMIFIIKSIGHMLMFLFNKWMVFGYCTLLILGMFSMIDYPIYEESLSFIRHWSDYFPFRSHPPVNFDIPPSDFQELVQRMALLERNMIDIRSNQNVIESSVAAIPTAIPASSPSAVSWNDFIHSNKDQLERIISSTILEQQNLGSVPSRDTLLSTLEQQLNAFRVDVDERLENSIHTMGEELTKMSRKQQQFEQHYQQPGQMYKSPSQIWSKLKSSSDGRITTSDGKDITSDIQSLIDSAIRKHSKDVLAKPDYALFTAGARVIPSLTSPTYQIKPSGYKRLMAMITGKGVIYGRPPVTALHPDISVGSCWAFPGSSAQLGILLNYEVVVEDVTIEHAPKEVSFDLSSAPKDFEVWGVVQDSNALERLRAYRKEQENNHNLDGLDSNGSHDDTDDDDHQDSIETISSSDPLREDHILLAVGSYDPFAEDHVQTFPVLESTRKLDLPVSAVVVRILSTHGNPARGCLYRVRVGGKQS